MIKNDLFLRALRGASVDRPPVWMMRQAGRYLPEYRATRAEAGDFLSLCYNSELAAEVTLQPIRRYGFDAAILFADILLLPQALGVDLWFETGEGPRLEPITDIDSLKDPEEVHEVLNPIYETVKRLSASLPSETTLIGFAGAPFTLASYAVEGKGSRNYVHVKKMMYQEPEAWHALMAKLTDSLASYLQLQIDAGVDAIQIFDTWVGSLSVADFEAYALPHTQALIDKLRGQVPIIYFGTGNGHLLPSLNKTKPDVVAFDWRTPLVPTWDALGCTAVQGNMDPIVLCADRATVSAQAGSA